jgi:mannitol/fructose-specific phosphotransferase system IIA component
VKGGYVEPEYVQAMLDREKLTSTYLGESIAVPHGTIEAKDRVLKTGVVFCQYPEGFASAKKKMTSPVWLSVSPHAITSTFR